MRLGIVKGAAIVLSTAVLAVSCGDEEEGIPTEPAISGSTAPPVVPPPVDPVEDLGQTVLDVTSADDDLSIFERLLGQLNTQGLADTLSGEGALTVFVPSDEAFDTLPFEVSDFSPEQLATILSYHVIAGARITSSMVEDGSSEDSLEGRALRFDVSGDAVVVNGLTSVTRADIEASNGVVHVVDTLLIPPRFPFPGTLADVVSYYPGLATLHSAVGDTDDADSGLAKVLGEDNSHTVFAPGSSGFSEDSSSLPEDVEALADVFRYHVLTAQGRGGRSLSVFDIVTAANANGLGQATFPSLAGPRVVASTTDGDLRVNDSNVIFSDLVASNGVMHVIDRPLTPPKDLETIVRADPELSIFVEALMATRDSEDSMAILPTGNTVDDGGLTTVFAPTNAAFEAIGVTSGSDFSEFRELLRYHLLDRQVDANAVAERSADERPTVRTNSAFLLGSVFGEVFVSFSPASALSLNGYAQVVATDIVASDGILHKIDAVLYPPLIERNLNLVEVLSAYPRFSALVERLEEQGLTNTLADNSSEFTVFAPTNGAFEALEAAPEGDNLTDLLRYHVLKGRIDSNSFEFFFPSFRTLDGDNLGVRLDEDVTILLNGNTKVLVTDIVGSNGVIHVIDSVLIPADDP